MLHPKPTRLAASLGLTTALTTAAIAVPAYAAVTGPGVQPGHNITVFHNIDFVAVFGYPVGDDVTVDVLRGEHRIASATGRAVDTPEGGALEVNHGPAGAPAPGDCWSGTTPDIRPGDRIQVRHGTTTDEVTVDDIAFAGDPTLTGAPDPVAGGPPEGTVELRGHARTTDPDGNVVPIGAARLDSGEVRTVGRVRATPTEIVDDPSVEGGFIARYAPPTYGVTRNDGGLDQNEVRDEILDPGAGHAIGFGHVPPPLPPEAMLVDGIEDVHGPALGCEGSPAAVNAIGTRSADAINIATLAAAPGATDPVVTFSGPAGPDVTEVTVTLSNGTSTTPVPGTLNASTPGGHQGWSASFTRAQVEALADGTLTATASFTGAGTTSTGPPMTLQKDVVAPTVTSDPAPGTYEGPKAVGLVPGGATSTSYRTDGVAAGPGDARYAGIPIVLQPGSRTITAYAVDAAGNETRTSLPFTITAPPAPVPVDRAAGTGGTAGAGPAPAPGSPLADPGPAAPPGSAAAPPRVTSLSVPRQITRSKAGRSGFVLTARIPVGAKSLRIAILRRKPSGKLVRAALVVRATPKTGMKRIGLRTSAVRRALTVGRYVVRVSPRNLAGVEGKHTDARMRVTR